jgi:hypothetical protein
MDFLKLNKIWFGVLLFGLVTITSCRKEDPLELPAPNSGGAPPIAGGSGVGPSVPPVTGSLWTDITPNAGDRIEVLATINNQLLISHLWSGGLSAIYSNGTFNYCLQSIGSFGVLCQHRVFPL